jgi:hypothetical protein
MPGFLTPDDPIPDGELDTCIDLVVGVSYRASSHDLVDKQTAHGRIVALMNHPRKWWRTWWHKADDGTIDACCFFQRMRGRQRTYAMCVGFSSTMADDGECEAFLDEMAGDGNSDKLLRYAIKQVSGNLYVNIVDQPLTQFGQDRQVNLNNLFRYIRTHSQTPNGTSWTLTRTEINVHDLKFWGGDGVDVWQLVV